MSKFKNLVLAKMSYKRGVNWIMRGKLDNIEVLAKSKSGRQLYLLTYRAVLAVG